MVDSFHSNTIDLRFISKGNIQCIILQINQKILFVKC
jgi:hypothetical protein